MRTLAVPMPRSFPTAVSQWLPFMALALAGLVASQPLSGQQDTLATEGHTPARWETSHTLQLQGQQVQYDAVVGSIILTDDAERPTGELFYTSYTRTDAADQGRRPIVFSYNGGPGSASFWLHMGIMGPRRVVTPNVGQQAPAPYPVEDNQYTLLDVADIVMIDPIGTGFSRTLGDTPGSHFWGIDEDAASLSQFIRRFLSQNQRWNSPLYLLGESYGTTRSAVLARHLQNANTDLNGIILVSSVLDFQTIQFPPQAIVPYVVNVPAYAVTAAYHEALPGGAPSDLDAFMAEVEAWSIGEYAHVLLAGSAVDPARRSAAIQQLHRYIGLSPEYLDAANLRVNAGEFRQELLRSQGVQVGRLDARFTGPIGEPLDRTPTHDVQSTAISSAYTSAFNEYLRTELGYDGLREYVPSGRARPWNWSRGGGGRGDTPNVASDLAEAMLRNPELEVLLINGIYDLATPYFAAVWTMDQLGLPADFRARIHRSDFTAGHMMYVDQTLLPQWREVIVDFLERTSGPP